MRQLGTCLKRYECGRKEAGWAVFFDTLQIEWRYEHEDFILSPLGECYLPDFYLPDMGYWIEVKPEFPSDEAQRKAYLLNCGFAADENLKKRREHAYILYGDIPWQFPKQGNLIGYAVNEQVEEDSSEGTKWGIIKGLCWQQCLLCDEIMIGQINTMSCDDCMAELGTLVDEALDAVPGIPVFEQVVGIVPAMVAGAVNTRFFRSEHKTSLLRQAYTAARGMQFEGRGYRRSA